MWGCIYVDIFLYSFQVFGVIFPATETPARQSMNRALERFKQLCLAEQRRLSSAGGELLGVYAAARRQAPAWDLEEPEISCWNFGKVSSRNIVGGNSPKFIGI